MEEIEEKCGLCATADDFLNLNDQNLQGQIAKSHHFLSFNVPMHFSRDTRASLCVLCNK